MGYYPVLLNLHGKNVVVVGGGIVAQRKIQTLLEHGARVKMVAKELTPALSSWAQAGRVDFLGPEFEEVHLKDAFAVIAATNDVSMNRQVSELARANNLLVNAVDQPSECNFIVPSILRRGDLIISVSTSGKSPALAKKMREELEDRFGDEYALFLSLMGKLREEILAKSLSQKENRRIFQELVDSPLLSAIRRQDWNEAAKIVGEILQMRFSRDDFMNYLKVE
jgi:precorrin-2 dehydrogenase/sirohydrochlorin ferrochelatase